MRYPLNLAVAAVLLVFVLGCIIKLALNWWPIRTASSVPLHDLAPLAGEVAPLRTSAFFPPRPLTLATRESPARHRFAPW